MNLHELLGLAVVLNLGLLQLTPQLLLFVIDYPQFAKQISTLSNNRTDEGYAQQEK